MIISGLGPVAASPAGGSAMSAGTTIAGSVVNTRRRNGEPSFAAGGDTTVAAGTVAGSRSRPRTVEASSAGVRPAASFARFAASPASSSAIRSIVVLPSPERNTLPSGVHCN